MRPSHRGGMSEHATDDPKHVPGTSVSPDFAALFGYRETDCVVLFSPAEQGYRCPIHGPVDLDTDGGLEWSQYSACLWCPDCDRDYPTALCTGFATDDVAVLDRAIEVFVSSIRQAVARSASTHHVAPCGHDDQD